MKTGLTTTLPVMVTKQVPVPEQPPDQPENTQPASGEAVKFTTAPSGYVAAQVPAVEVHPVIPVTSEDTVPEPVATTASAKVRGVEVDMGVAVSVGVAVAVIVGVGVAVNVKVAVSVDVTVEVSVEVEVSVTVEVTVKVPVTVGVFVMVGVPVIVGVLVIVGVFVTVDVGVMVGVNVAVSNSHTKNAIELSLTITDLFVDES
jgi:hypothetical protein